jgi:hypothetical protein
MSEPGLKFNPWNSSWTEPNTSGGPEITWYLQLQSHAEQNDFTVDPAAPHHFYSPHTSSRNHCLQVCLSIYIDFLNPCTPFLHLKVF